MRPWRSHPVCGEHPECVDEQSKASMSKHKDLGRRVQQFQRPKHTFQRGRGNPVKFIFGDRIGCVLEPLLDEVHRLGVGYQIVATPGHVTEVLGETIYVSLCLIQADFTA